MTKAEFGLYNNFTSWLAIITIVVTLNLESTLISARYDYEDKFDEYIFSILTLSSVSTVFWLAVVNLVPHLFINWFDLDLRYINAMLIYLLLIPAVNLFQARERYFFEYKKTVASSLFIAIGTAVLSVVLVSTMKDKLTGRIYGAVIPTIVLGIGMYFFFFLKGKRIKIQYWKYALPICLPFIPHLLSLNLLNSMDRVMITKWCGEESTAVYGLAYTCGSLVTLLVTSLNGAFAPWVGERLNEGNHSKIRSFSKIYIECFSALAVGIMLIAPEVLFILGGNDYSEAKYVLTPVSMGCVCQFLYTLFVNVEQFKKRTIGMAFASAAAALINYILNAIFIPRVGYLAAAYTTLVGYLCLLIIHMFLVYRLNLHSVYDYKFIGLVVATMMLITVMITVLYSYSVLRYMFIILYCIIFLTIILKHKDRLMTFIKRR